MAGAPLADLSEARARAVAGGVSLAPTAAYSLDGAGQPQLAPTSDPDLRLATFGDLATAEAIAVLVPGVSHTAAEFDRPDGSPDPTGSLVSLPDAARMLQAVAAADGAAVVTVAWLGYEPPGSVATALRAGPLEQGAANLAAFQEFLRSVRPEARITWVCHSYGSLVCAAAREARPDAIVLLGSPGVELDGAAAFTDLGVELFAAGGDDDPIGFTQAMRPLGIGFGPDPADIDFGAQIIACSPGTRHSDYLLPGTASLEGVAAAVLGRPQPAHV
ncbi:MAG: alpha/beta hydrolase family protein [Bifidobacteriaceae bacterium]|nr:alpha/beta hydrolase family protein [Bifidobacteriaceae bacterium]